MDNATRSETTRKKAIEAALIILTRDGVKGLTFDSLAQESGISKGGLMHQFRTKDAVLKALLAHQRQDFDRIATIYQAGEGAAKREKTLSMEIATYKAAANQPHSVARALLAIVVENPQLLLDAHDTNLAMLKRLQQEAEDPELSMLRYFAASGIAFNFLLGISPLSNAARERLFARLLDDDAWHGLAAPEAPKKRAPRRTKPS